MTLILTVIAVVAVAFCVVLSTFSPLRETEHVVATDQRTDALYRDLLSEPTEEGRDKLVAQAIADGVPLSEIRDMLDYIDII